MKIAIWTVVCAAFWIVIPSGFSAIEYSQQGGLYGMNGSEFSTFQFLNGGSFIVLTIFIWLAGAGYFVYQADKSSKTK